MNMKAILIVAVLSLIVVAWTGCTESKTTQNDAGNGTTNTPSNQTISENHTVSINISGKTWTAFIFSGNEVMQISGSNSMIINVTGDTVFVVAQNTYVHSNIGYSVSIIIYENQTVLSKALGAGNANNICPIAIAGYSF